MPVDDDDEHEELHFGRALSDPTFTFTLPSIHDGIALDCRVYHPASLSVSPGAPSWDKHAAIVAHPYAPLGGNQDDNIVGVAASTLLRLGYLVCTFNFRGASGSAGRTSWTAKGERADYMSVVGFVAHYVHFLDPFRRPQPVEQLAERNDNTPSPVLLLAGYSYGAMVTTQLPSLDTILETFKTPVSGSPAAEIRLRAEYMADTENTVLASARAAALDRQGTRSPRKAMAMRVGGDEQNRKSHDIPRRSFSLEAEEKFRDLIAKTRKGHRAGVSVSSMPKKPSSTSIRSVPNEQGEREASKRIQPLAAMTRFQPAYLLISPPQGIITRLATMSMSNPFAKKTARVPDSPPSMPRGADSRTTAAGTSSAALAWEAEHKLVNNPSLAVYGDQDIFVPVKKVREWAQRLQGTPGSRFSAHEISTAGHFWTEEGVLYIMRDALKTFARELLVPEPEARALTR